MECKTTRWYWPEPLSIEVCLTPFLLSHRQPFKRQIIRVHLPFYSLSMSVNGSTNNIITSLSGFACSWSENIIKQIRQLSASFLLWKNCFKRAKSENHASKGLLICDWNCWNTKQIFTSTREICWCVPIVCCLAVCVFAKLLKVLSWDVYRRLTNRYVVVFWNHLRPAIAAVECLCGPVGSVSGC